MRRLSADDADSLFGGGVDRNAPDRRFRLVLDALFRFGRAVPMGQDKAAFVVEHPFELVVRVDPRNHTVAEFQRFIINILLYLAEKPFDGIFQPLLRNGRFFERIAANQFDRTAGKVARPHRLSTRIPRI